MTGEKDRYKTHEQLWKLEDGELSTPKHDEMVLQLLNKENAYKLLSLFDYDSAKWEYSIKRLYPQYIHTLNEDRDEYPHNYMKDLDLHIKFDDFLNVSHQVLLPMGEALYEDYQTSKPNVSVDVSCEVPLVTGTNKFIMGYLDIQYRVFNFSRTHRLIQDKSFKFEYDYQRYVNSEPIIETITVNPSGYVEIYNKSFRYSTKDECYLNIEVKPQIKSFGETLRQVNTYKEVFPNAIYIIYSPDTMFKKAFESQGIYFITPSDLGIK